MTVRAKVRLVRTEQTMQSVIVGKDENGSHKWDKVQVTTLVMQPVSGGSDENEKFFASTPSGEIKLGVIPPDVAAQFELDREYYVTFVPA